MFVGWLAHRRFTFRLTTPPTLAEFLRYAAVRLDGGRHQLRHLRGDRSRAARHRAALVALFISSLIAMVFAYLGMRFAAFRQLGGPS